MAQAEIILSLSVVALSIAFIIYDQVTKRIPTRLVDHQAPRGRYGLVEASTHSLPARAGGVDIIFVHGLGSNPDTTWRATRRAPTPDAREDVRPDGERYVTWVSDFLPEDLPRDDVRLFFYNYDSYWKRDALHTRLFNLGDALLEQIHDKICVAEAERGRALIFVAYSYGGLVVKQALVRAQLANPKLRNIAERTKGILFLGTPHRGSSFSTWGRGVAQALLPLGSNPSLLAELEAFVAIDREDLRVFNFYEQRPTRIFRLWFLQWEKLCVREPSATYEGPRVRNVGLSVDHKGLNKFGSRDESYAILLSKLREIVTSSACPRKHLYTVPLETVPTYTQRDRLWEELEAKLQIRHEKASVPYAAVLYGLGGAGKSQLALKYAEDKRDRYNTILWIDAASEEAVRSSFERCAVAVGLPDHRIKQQESALEDDSAVQAVLRWLRARTEADEEWLVIVDNADDFTWGLQKIMPKGARGSVLVTSQDELSHRLIPQGCEQIRVGDLSPLEGTTLLLQHLGCDPDSVSEEVRTSCSEVAQQLGYLALAIDLAGAYIGNDAVPEQALTQYLKDFKRHRDELLQMDVFRGLRPTEKTVWTVWDTTLQKIAKDHKECRPDLLLTFLAHFKGAVIQDEVFRLAALGTTTIGDALASEIPLDLQQFFPVDREEWDKFRYRQSRDVLLRYSLLKRVDGTWPGVTMHGLVQWRARQTVQTDQMQQQWRWWYTMFIAAACHQIKEEDHQPEFRRHLMVHLPDVSVSEVWDDGRDVEMHELFIRKTLGRAYYDEGWWEEAKKLQVQVMKTSKTKLGPDHPDTLTSINNLASTYRDQGRWEEAKKLQVQVMKTSKTKLGPDHPNTLMSMNNLASTLWKQGRWEEAEKVQVQVMETYKAKLGADHPDTLIHMHNLAFIWKHQGRHTDALALVKSCLQARQRVLGLNHPDTLSSLVFMEEWSG
ncbi:putative kinesin light chain [Diplogelasinospora grovesii]|uniref:Kinesin light chain n=1 Tax=Diplogelasinospora grovesii TaxID=303347 RepID=A0AAN6S2E4_9PEZI|nr:putative kinesin light chain [Diplogelasinospora grovesii]